MLARALPAILAGLFAGFARADITVLPDGSTGPVVGLAQALELAAPGETLFLMPGDYAGVEIRRQSVRIVGPGAEWVTIGTPEGAETGQNLAVRELAHDEEFFLTGVTLDQQGVEQFGPTFEALHCEGPVALHDVVVRSTAAGSQETASVVLCSSTIFDRCDIAGSTATPNAGLFGGSALDCQESPVSINHCKLVGGTSSVGLFATGGKAALSVKGGWIRVHGGELRGGTAFPDPLPLGGIPGAAILIAAGTVELSGGGGTLVQGADGYLSSEESVDGAPAVVVGLIGTVVHYGGPAIQGGTGGDGTVAEAFDSSGLLEVVPIPGGQHRPGLYAVPSSVAPGEGFELVVEGTPTRTQFVYFATELKRAYAIPGFLGIAYLDPTVAKLEYVQAVGLDGRASIAVAVPNEPALLGLAGWFQSYEVQSPGPIPRLGLPAAVAIR